MGIRESVQLQTVLSMYEQEIHQDRSRPSYQQLKTVVRKHIDQMIRTRSFKVRNQRIGTGVLVKSQEGKMSALGGGKENAISGKQKDSVPRSHLFSMSCVPVDRTHQHSHTESCKNHSPLPLVHLTRRRTCETFFHRSRKNSSHGSGADSFVAFESPRKQSCE